MYCKKSKERPIYIKYFNAIQNWGDLVGPYLVQKISGREVVRVRIGWREHLLAVGSLLSEANSKSLVWGAGFISQDSKLKTMPERITMVRGPKTLAKLNEYGFEEKVPLGDPALLMPRYYFPEIQKTHSVGYVPHYIDRDVNTLKALKDKGIKVIDIRQDVEPFVDEILSCEAIFSSSLHGLIAADTYGLNSKWVQGSSKIIGGRFKFDDYYESLSIINEQALDQKAIINMSESALVAEAWRKNMDIDHALLLSAFPYVS